MSSSDPTLPADDAPAPAPATDDTVAAPDVATYDAEDMYPPDAVPTLVDDEEPSLLSRLGAEMLGSFGLVFAGVGVALYASFTGAGVLGVALAFGLALFVLVAALGHISGGHFNPVVTLGAALAGRARWVDVVPYWLAQLVGAALAVTALVVALRTVPTVTPEISNQILGGAANGYDQLSPFVAIADGGFGIVAAILIEVIIAGVFVAVVLGVTSRGPRALAAPAIGLAYAVGVLVAMPVTNGSLNPVRSTAVAIFAGGEYVSQLWVFWVAPLLGAAIAGLIFGLLRPADLDSFDELEEHEVIDETEIVEVETRP